VVAAVLAAVSLGALVSLAPRALGLSQVPLLAQAVALRGVLALAALGAGAVLLVLWALSRRRPRALLAAAVLLSVGAGHAGVLVARGLAAPPPDAREADLVVLSLNTLGGASSPQHVARAARAADADVLALPETGADLAGEVARLLGPWSAWTGQRGSSPVGATSLVVADRLGPLEQVVAPRLALGAVSAAPVGDGGVLTAVHPPPPLPLAAGVGAWSADVAEAAAACRATPGAVVAGDFNATLDHAALADLGPCVDAAAEVGAAGVATWPASASRLLGAPIDHVLVDARAWRVLSVQVLDVGGSDHRALVVRLARRG